LARTVVYDTTHPGTSGSRGPDGVASKIAKYVPAELVSIATLFFAAFTLTGWRVWLFVAVGAVFNVLYLLSVSRAAKDTPNPRVYFYVLSAVAFILWSMATIDSVAAAAHLSGSTSSGQRAFILALAAFSMPMLDTLFSGSGTKGAGRSGSTQDKKETQVKEENSGG
jgi:uncharacterized membrane protein YecN with MAPEG domain